MFLICHMTSQIHMIEWSCSFLSESFSSEGFSLYVTNLPSLVALGIAVVEIYF